MEIALLIHFSMSCVQIPPVEDGGASWSVDGLPRTIDIVPTIDWIFQIVCLSLDDMLWICSGLSP